MEFFTHQGAVESANLMPPKPGQNARAAFVNFYDAITAENAAEVCDNLPVDSETFGPGSHRLVCSIKRAPGQKVDMVSGFSDLSKARQERRAVYISGLPIGYTSVAVRALLKSTGVVEDVKELPATRNQSCFALMSSSEEASDVIEQWDGQLVEGKQISVSYPKPPKRTRDPESSTEVVVEVRGFPSDTLPTEVSSIIESGGREVLTVKMLRHNSLDNTAMAIVHLRSIEDARGVVEEMSVLEIVPGVKLEASIKNEPMALPQSSGLPQLQDAGESQPPPPKRLKLDGQRQKGEIVGKLLKDGPAVASSSKGLQIKGSSGAASVPPPPPGRPPFGCGGKGPQAGFGGKGPRVPPPGFAVKGARAPAAGSSKGAPAASKGAPPNTQLQPTSKAAPAQRPPKPRPSSAKPSSAPHLREW